MAKATDFTRLVLADPDVAHSKLFQALKRNGFDQKRTAGEFGVTQPTFASWIKRLRMHYTNKQPSKRATDALKKSRMIARTQSSMAIRMIERTLVDILTGERLRGLPNLATKAYTPYFAIRVRGKSDECLPLNRPVLVLDESGMLMMATCSDGLVSSKVAQNEDLRSEDVVLFARKVGNLLEKHIELCKSATERYDRCRQVADAIINALSNLKLDDSNL